MAVHRAFQWFSLGRVARKHVQAGFEVVHPMHEQAEVQRRVPGDGIPGDGTLRVAPACFQAEIAKAYSNSRDSERSVSGALDTDPARYRSS